MEFKKNEIQGYDTLAMNVQQLFLKSRFPFFTNQFPTEEYKLLNHISFNILEETNCKQ